MAMGSMVIGPPIQLRQQRKTSQGAGMTSEDEGSQRRSSERILVTRKDRTDYCAVYQLRHDHKAVTTTPIYQRVLK